MLLLHYDACATVINGTAQTPKDVTQNPEIRSMLEGESDSLSTNFKPHIWRFIFYLFIQADCSASNLYVSPLFSLLFGTPAAERTEERKLEEELLDAAREGDLSTLTRLVSAGGLVWSDSLKNVSAFDGSGEFSTR